MNISDFYISLKEIETLLKRFRLFRMCGIKSINNDGVSNAFKIASQNESYFKAYTIALDNYDYDFLLIDQSFFQFELKVLSSTISEVRYAYFQNPIKYKSYQEFLREEKDKGNIDGEIEEIGDILLEEYDQFLNEQELNSNHTTIRYDLDLNNYQPLIHSVSHLHIGHLNNIRIPLNKSISPLAFVLFVIKNVYYYEWKEFISDQDSACKILKQGRLNASALPSQIWCKNEELELFIN